MSSESQVTSQLDFSKTLLVPTRPNSAASTTISSEDFPPSLLACRFNKLWAEISHFNRNDILKPTIPSPSPSLSCPLPSSSAQSSASSSFSPSFPSYSFPTPITSYLPSSSIPPPPPLSFHFPPSSFPPPLSSSLSSSNSSSLPPSSSPPPPPPPFNPISTSLASDVSSSFGGVLPQKVQNSFLLAGELGCSGVKEKASKHKITVNQRKRMLDWMLEVKRNFKLANKTWYLAVDIMDKYFLKSVSSLLPSSLHLLGIISIWLASKFEDVFPLNFSSVLTNIGHLKFSKKDILDKENELMETLEWKVGGGGIEEAAQMAWKLVEIEKEMTEDLNHLGVAIMDYIFKFLLMEYNCMFTEDNGLIVGGAICVTCKMLEAIEPSFSLSLISEKLMDLLDYDKTQLNRMTNKILNLLKNEEFLKDCEFLKMKRAKIEKLQKEYF